MTLEAFLANHALDAVETLPDDRLINVVVDGGALYGVVVDNSPDDVAVTRREPAVLNGATITVDGLTFDTRQHVMLPQPVEYND